MFIVYKVRAKEVPIQNVGSSLSLISPPLFHIYCTHVPSMLYSQDTT